MACRPVAGIPAQLGASRYARWMRGAAAAPSMTWHAYSIYLISVAVVAGAVQRLTRGADLIIRAAPMRHHAPALTGPGTVILACIGHVMGFVTVLVMVIRVTGPRMWRIASAHCLHTQWSPFASLHHACRRGKKLLILAASASRQDQGIHQPRVGLRRCMQGIADSQA